MPMLTINNIYNLCYQWRNEIDWRIFRCVRWLGEPGVMSENFNNSAQISIFRFIIINSNYVGVEATTSGIVIWGTVCAGDGYMLPSY